MADPIDPRNLRMGTSPSLVKLTSGNEVFVAKASILDSGWVATTAWDGTYQKVPEHRIQAIQRLETERYPSREEDPEMDYDDRQNRVADAEWRAKAVEWYESARDGDGESAPSDGSEPESAVTVVHGP